MPLFVVDRNGGEPIHASAPSRTTILPSKTILTKGGPKSNLQVPCRVSSRIAIDSSLRARRMLCRLEAHLQPKDSTKEEKNAKKNAATSQFHFRLAAIPWTMNNVRGFLGEVREDGSHEGCTLVHGTFSGNDGDRRGSCSVLFQQLSCR